MQTVARIKKAGKHFEIIVDLDKALELKKGSNVPISDALISDAVFSDHKKGLKPSEQDLQEAFNTTDLNSIAIEIIKHGEVQLPVEYRARLRQEKLKQIVSFLSRNAIDPRTKAVHPAERIEQAIKHAGIKIDENKSIDEQINQIISGLSRVLPIKLETKRIEIIVPATFTGKVYSLLSKYSKEDESWLDDGSLRCIISLPTALQPEFYDKLNKSSHGTAMTKEL
jgi:ribosome maturation protein SDO1